MTRAWLKSLGFKRQKSNGMEWYYIKTKNAVFRTQSNDKFDAEHCDQTKGWFVGVCPYNYSSYEFFGERLRTPEDFKRVYYLFTGKEVKTK